MDPSLTMAYTPARAKRNSKAPERFSSDDVKVDTPNNDTLSFGKSGEKSSKKSSSSSSTNKTTIREPLKVKLPKLKRPHTTALQIKVKLSRNSNASGGNANPSGGSSVGKIKLKPIPQKTESAGADKKPDSPEIATANRSDGSQTTSTSSKSDLKLTLPTKTTSSDDTNHDEPDCGLQANISADSNSAIADHDTSMEGELDSSFSSDSTSGSAMQIIVEKKSEQNDSGIRCPCGVNDDLGVMVECESCTTWQHGHCINVGIMEDAYEGYVCGHCSLPPGKHHDSLRQLTVGDKFQSKFAALEALMRKGANDDEDHSSEPTDENQGAFSPNELKQVVQDLRRVFTSLKVKWKLLTNEDYSAELKIWGNPIWSEKMEENLKQKQQQTVSFVGDVYKNNLKLNVCNMLSKMHRRCQLIRYQISRLEGSEASQDSKSTFESLLTTLDDISKVVEDYSDKLKQN